MPRFFLHFARNSQASQMNPYVGEILTLFVSIAALIGAYRFYGLIGLYAYSILGVLLANIQVFKVVDLGLGNNFALGTTVMSTLFIASDFITEKHGATQARRLVNLTFIGYFLFVCLITITIKQTLPETASNYNIESQNALAHLFLPAPGFFVASLIAFILSQNVDISIYAFLKKNFANLGVFMRASTSSIIATFADNLIFSFLAWIVFHPNPLPLEVVLYTYVLNGFFLRVVLALLNAPIVRLLQKIEPRHAM